MSYVEGNRFLYLETPLGADKLLLQSFTGNEGLNRLFDFQLELLAENKTTVNFDQLIGQKVSFGIQGAEKSLGARHFNGIVVELSQGDRDQDFTSYSMRVVPDIWRLTRKFQSRIFQHLSVPDILKKVLDGYDVAYQIQGTFEPRDYCTQYRETDFNFLSRLTEAEGIYYFFKFAKGSHQLVVANMPSSHPDTANPTLIFESVGGGVREDERITDWQKEQSWGPGKYTTWDHHFQLPHRKLQGQETAGITVQAGKVSHKLGLAGNDKLEIYDYPATYAHRFDGINKSGGEQPDDLQKISPDAKRSVGIWMQQQEAAMLRIQAAGNCRSVTAGHKFTLQRHFNGDGQYVITRATHAAGEGDFRSAQNAGKTHYSNSFECIPFALPFRPPQASQRPIIAGPQTAVVVGPAGEEIFTDKYGRVKVQFHWDRDGKYDGDSSCWLRVATMWAGKQWGSVFLPRIGHEVIVGFMEGDPDRPVIVGSVYNADTMPPYELPANKTRSGIKSDSSMGSGGFNEIRFEDLKGKEQIFIHGQKDSDTRIENDCREWIGEDRHLIVKRDQYEEVDRDLHLKVVRDQKEAIQGDRHLAVTGKEAIQVTGSHSFQVTGNVATQFGANHTEQTTGSYFLQAQSIVLEGQTSICLTVGSNFISILPAGIFINGMPMVNINSGGAAIPGIPGMLVSPIAPGPAIEADQAIAGSEVGYSADGAPPSSSSSGGSGSGGSGSSEGSGASSGGAAAEAAGAAGTGTAASAEAAGGAASTAGTGASSPTPTCSITPQAVATVPSNRARTRLGVGESTLLTFSLGAATWTISPATGAGSLSSTSGASVTYTAPDRANTVTITATGGGCSSTITLTIVEPSSIRMQRKPSTLGNHTRGTPSVGFIGDIYILPADVSFENCSYLEDEAYAVGTGCFQQYMADHQVGHNPNTSPITIGPPVSDTSGSKVNGYDQVAATGSSCNGGWTHSIPWRFQVGSGASKVFSTVDQVIAMTAAGGADISKAGASNHSDLNSATEKDPLFN